MPSSSGIPVRGFPISSLSPRTFTIWHDPSSPQETVTVSSAIPRVQGLQRSTCCGVSDDGTVQYTVLLWSPDGFQGRVEGWWWALQLFPVPAGHQLLSISGAGGRGRAAQLTPDWSSLRGAEKSSPASSPASTAAVSAASLQVDGGWEQEEGEARGDARAEDPTWPRGRQWSAYCPGL